MCGISKGHPYSLPPAGPKRNKRPPQLRRALAKRIGDGYCFGAVAGAGAGAMGSGRFVSSTAGCVTFNVLLPGTAAGVVVGGCGVVVGVAGCVAVPGMPAGGLACISPR